MSDGIVYKFGNRETVGQGQLERIASVCAEYGGAPQLIVVAAPRPLTSILEHYSGAKQSGAPEADGLRDEAVTYMDEQLFPMFDDTTRATVRDDFSTALLKGSYDDRDYFPALGHQKVAQYLTALVTKLSGTRVVYREPHVIFGNKDVDRDATKAAIRSANDLGQFSGRFDRVIIPGGYGEHMRRENSIGKRTLGYKGADRTAALYASQLGRPLTIWSSTKNGVHSADPDLVPGAIQHSDLTRAEVRGIRSGLFQENIIKDLNGSEISTTLRSMHELDNPGTQVHSQRDISHEQPVVLVAGEHLKTIDLYQNGIGDEVKKLEKMAHAAGMADLSIRAALGIDDYQSLAFADWVKPKKIADLAEKFSGSNAIVECSTLGAMHVAGESIAQGDFTRDEVEITVRQVLLAQKIKVLSSQSSIHAGNPSPSITFFVKPEELEHAIRHTHRELIEQ